MKIFISWSGKRSKYIAEQLRDWLPKVLQFTKPWCSSKDIGAGEFWSDKLRKQIKDSEFAIVCLTEENLNSSWVMYEVGAISERLGGKVSPYLFQMSPSVLANSPLSLLQAVTTSKEDTLKLLMTLNDLAVQQGMGPLGGALPEKSFELCWKELDDFFKKPELCAAPETGQKNLDLLASANSIKDVLLATKSLIEELSKNTPIDRQLKLKEKIAQLSAHLETLNSVAINVSVWNEAAIWLRENQKHLVDTAVEEGLKKHAELKNLGRSLDSPEKITKFKENVNNYLFWVLTLLEKKTDKIPLDETPIIPDESIYNGVFVHITEAVRNHETTLSEIAKNVIATRLKLLVEKFSC